MAKKVIAIIMIIMMLCINVNAEVLAPGQNVPTMISLDSTVNRAWNPTTWPMDEEKAFVRANNQYPRPTIALWQSRIMAGEFYKINIDLTPDDPYRPDYGVTGFLEKSDDLCVYLVDASTLIGNIDVSESMYGVQQWGRQVGLSEDDRLPDNTYQIFYDKSARRLSVLLMTEETMTDYYLVVRLGLWTTDEGQNGHIIYRYSTIHVEGAYTEILNDIKQILEESAAGGGSGLTEEQLNEAIQEALIAHEQWQDNQGNQIIGDAEQTLEEHFGQYFDAADEIRQSLAGISDALSYSGTDGVLVLPEARNPMADDALLWTRKEIDLVAAWNGIPQALRSVVSIVVTMSILTAIAKEVLSILEMWNTEKDLFGR